MVQESHIACAMCGAEFIDAAELVTDYTGGMPATLIGGTAWNYEVTMRCGVDPYGGGGPDISQKRIVCCG